MYKGLSTKRQQRKKKKKKKEKKTFKLRSTRVLFSVLRTEDYAIAWYSKMKQFG